MVDIYRAAKPRPKNNFICENIPTKATLFLFGCSEVNSTLLITSELANQRAQKVLFTCNCVVYTNIYILLDVLLCSIAEYFYELCRILASP